MIQAHLIRRPWDEPTVTWNNFTQDGALVAGEEFSSQSIGSFQPLSRATNWWLDCTAAVQGQVGGARSASSCLGSRMGRCSIQRNPRRRICGRSSAFITFPD